MALKTESNTWCWVFVMMDTMFAIDMVLTFFTTLPPKEGEDEVTDRKKIAKEYFKTWFFLELFAILPFDLIFTALTGNPALCGVGGSSGCDDLEQAPSASSNVLLRFPRMLKITRAIRLLRMLKIFKLMKNKDHL